MTDVRVHVHVLHDHFVCVMHTGMYVCPPVTMCLVSIDMILYSCLIMSTFGSRLKR